MKIAHVRAISAKQVSSIDGPEKIQESDFCYYQLTSIGWKTGARVRQRNCKSIADLYTYLNKVLVGGYLSSDDYDRAWLLVARLEMVPFDRLLSNWSKSITREKEDTQSVFKFAWDDGTITEIVEK